MLFLNILHEVGLGELGKHQVVGGDSESVFDFLRCYLGGEGGEAPSKVGNVGVQLDG